MRTTITTLSAALMASILFVGCSSTEPTARIHDDVYYDPTDAPLIASTSSSSKTAAPTTSDDYYDAEESRKMQRYNDVAYNDPRYYNYSRFGFNTGFYGGSMMGSGMYMGAGWGSPGFGRWGNPYGGFYNDPFWGPTSYYDPYFNGSGSPYYGNGWNMGWGMNYGWGPYGYSPYGFNSFGGGGWYCPPYGFTGDAFAGNRVIVAPRPNMAAGAYSTTTGGVRSIPNVAGRRQVDLLRSSRTSPSYFDDHQRTDRHRSVPIMERPGNNDRGTRTQQRTRIDMGGSRGSFGGGSSPSRSSGGGGGSIGGRSR